MKVYSRPEVLEDHIAPAAISITPIPGENPNVGVVNNPDFSTGNLNNIVIITSDLTIATPVPPTPELPSQSIDFSEFRIRTVRVGIDSLIGEPAVEVQDAAVQALIGTTTVESVLSDPTTSLLSDDLAVSNDVIEAISSAVGEDRSTALVGLSSDEFEKAGGSAFLTSL